MTVQLFVSWLTKLDKQKERQKRKILSFVVNCSAHKPVPPLKWVDDMQFFPDKTSSKLQPLDQGIIKHLKVLYRTDVVRNYFSDIEGKKSALWMC